MAAVPLDGWLTDVIVASAVPSNGPAVAFARGLRTVVTVALIDSASFFGSGGSSLPAVTVIETVAAGEVSVPSVAVYVNESLPTKFGSGVYDRFAPVPLSVPWGGSVVSNVSGSSCG